MNKGKKELNQADINLAFQAGQTKHCILFLYFIHANSSPSLHLRLEYINDWVTKALLPGNLTHSNKQNN